MQVGLNVNCLESLRCYLGLSPDSFSSILGISSQAYYYIRRGDHSPSSQVVINFFKLGSYVLGSNFLSLYPDLFVLSDQDREFLESEFRPPT